MDSASSPVSPAAPLLLTGEPALRDGLVRLCAAAGVSPEVLEDVEDARTRWRTASCVLLGGDVVAQAAGLSLPRRRDVVVVTAGVDATVWRHAVAVGAEQVIDVPAGQQTLVGWIGDTAEGTACAHMIGVVGARGGVGASTLATALALCAAHRGPTCLIDADPLSGGIELLLGSEDRGGLRWPELARTQGRIGAAALREALPKHRGVTVLSWARGSAAAIPVATMRSVLTAASRSFDVVVVDLPRALDAAAIEAVATADHVLLVATGDVRSVAAATAVLPGLTAHVADLQLVVRGTDSTATAESVAEALALPLACTLPTRRAIARDVEGGLGPPGRGAMMARCRDILDPILNTAVSS